MLKIRRLPLGQLQTNCYLLIERNYALIVDPGDDADFIQRILEDEEAKPTKIIATHGHYDHILAVTELKLAYNIPFLMHKADEFLLKRMGSSAKYFSGLPADPAPKIDEYLEEGDKFKVGKSSLKVIGTPGHTPGSIALHSSRLSVVFVGDLVFAEGGVGRTDFAYSSKKDLEKSIKKILKLPEKTTVHSGHGEETDVGEINKYLRTKSSTF